MLNLFRYSEDLKYGSEPKRIRELIKKEKDINLLRYFIQLKNLLIKKYLSNNIDFVINIQKMQDID